MGLFKNEDGEEEDCDHEWEKTDKTVRNGRRMEIDWERDRMVVYSSQYQESICVKCGQGRYLDKINRKALIFNSEKVLRGDEAEEELESVIGD